MNNFIAINRKEVKFLFSLNIGPNKIVQQENNNILDDLFFFFYPFPGDNNENSKEENNERQHCLHISDKSWKQSGQVNNRENRDTMEVIQGD